jgi:uncharacterized sporulation protein YeaH/YhbH (DUF444 family)
MNIIDRRLNPGGKNLPNRQRFLRRARKIVRDAVRKASASRGIRDVDEAGVVVIPADGIDEPHFHLGEKGFHHPVFPGNKEFVEGERLPRPPGSGRGSGRGQGAGEGKSEDEYRVALSAEEFLEFFLEDLELPDLERRRLVTTETEGVRRAGYSVAGSPANLSVSRTMRNSMSRRIALKRPNREEVQAAEDALAEIEARGGGEEERSAARAALEALQRRTRTIAWIDPIDIRYRRFEPVPKPSSQAVMFCLMDVSASMTEHMKDLAKRFFMLLYVFLKKRYKKVDIVFIRHTDEAKECDEETFFHGVESGGTRVSSALQELLNVAKDRYPSDLWNIYVAQASDGDNDSRDNAVSTALLAQRILPMSRYYAYLEVGEPGRGSGVSALWRAYQELGEEKLAQRSVTSREEIYPIFRELFSREANVRKATP